MNNGSEQVGGPGKVIAFHYDLYDEKSHLIESSRQGNPVLCLQGEHGVLLTLQDAFVGKRAGDDFSITVPHEKAYGRYYPNLIQRIARKNIDGGKRQQFRVGQVIKLGNPPHSNPATVIKVGKYVLDVDTNHPLAGQSLLFDVTIVSIRDASESERSDGHAHGSVAGPAEHSN
ncbi:MAG: FKBP-type peptidyl-prolyl cis-trans isomerase [Granulosicoccus sp.]|nr:FKBP-type peptidyl-prolyl cis-trans isomerase [Granulosicoccus sp.]